MRPSMVSRRILIVTIADLPEGGGHTSRLKTLAKCLVLQGHAVRIWSKHVLGHVPQSLIQLKGKIEDVPYEIVSGCATRTYGASSFFMKVRTTLRLIVRLIRNRNSADVLWLNQLSFHDMLPLMILGRLFGMAIIQSYEDEHIAICSERSLTLKQRWFTGVDNRLADRFLVRRADAVVVICQYLKEKFAACGAKCLTVVPTIVDIDFWRCGPPPADSRPRIFYSGSFLDIYALDETIGALGELKAEGLDFEFHCIGNLRMKSPDLERVLRLREQHGLTDNMTFGDLLPLRELQKEIERSTVLLSIRKDSRLSRSGLSTKLSEYLASGRPVITSAVGDVPIYLRDGESAFVLEEPTQAAIRHALRTCLTNPASVRRIAAGGLAAAERHFSFQAVGKTLNRLIANVYAGPSHIQTSTVSDTDGP